ncbi:MAG: sigma 54-interacting transcriptional regulator, partial [Verrucomicrobiota bacterium]
GTIFLDEIGDMSLATQTKILRVLQSGTFERVGGNQTVEVDVRVIAATNKPLEEAVAARQFREDLFYRLNVVRIQMPALRDRRTDIRLLVDYFLRRRADPAGKPKSIGPETLALLESYHWPGNVRELENVLRRATVVAKGQAILPSDLPAEVSHVGTIPSAPPPPSTPGTPIPQATAATPSDPQATSLAGLAQSLFRMGRTDPKLKVLPAVERVLVIEALKETRGNQVQAARLLGITRATLRKRIEKFGIRQDVSVN